jgi:hypothetical protein
MTLGLCGSCGTPGLDPETGALRFAIIISPGQRTGTSWSVVEQRLDNLWVCGDCIAGDTGAILRKVISDPFLQTVPPKPKHCEIHCWNPAPAGFRIIARDKLAPATCPHCFGDADLIAMPGAMIRRRTWRMRLTGKMFRRMIPDNTPAGTE